ncbi:MAG TPA: hypothetical protein PLJ26_07145, partial [Candidatus Omnitrophota bacterium]|nr:hypothetical protein [Candidatus Omnitrophota bacterium]
GLVVENFRINKNFNRTARLLITWTVRIEGFSKDYSINPEFCGNWYGSLTTKFPSGEVKTALYIDGQQAGPEVIMQVPAGQDIVAREKRPPSGSGFDPTLVGTYVLTADNFPGKKFPEKIGLIEIRWKNETSMDIVSPKGMRNMIINMMPVTKQ